MPNGGPDCCGNCSHNKAVQEMAHPHPEQYDLFWKLSYCTLRGVKITSPFWTYCVNFNYGKVPETRNIEDTPTGWITSSGLYEGYVRIPWDGEHEPRVSVPARCSVCGRTTGDGITINRGDAEFGFCTNRHYVEWWFSVHNDPSFPPEKYELPESRWKRMAID